MTRLGFFLFNEPQYLFYDPNMAWSRIEVRKSIFKIPLLFKFIDVRTGPGGVIGPGGPGPGGVSPGWTGPPPPDFDEIYDIFMNF